MNGLSIFTNNKKVTEKQKCKYAPLAHV